MRRRHVAQRLDKIMRSKISPCISSCMVVRGPSPLKNFENQECRRSHLRSFCNAIKVSNLPELCLFADVSEGKVPIYSMFLNVFEAGPASSVVAGSILTPGTFFLGDLVMKKIYDQSLPSADSRRAVVSYWRKNVHY